MLLFSKRSLSLQNSKLVETRILTKVIIKTQQTCVITPMVESRPVVDLCPVKERS